MNGRALAVALGSLVLVLIMAALPENRAIIAADDPWVVYEGTSGPGAGKHIVFVTGDDEYRSEEGMPQLARILAVHHGFKCTVLFAIDPATGTITPDRQDNIPGTAMLGTADLMVLFTRFRDLPDAQMKPIVEYVESGKPIVGLRTSTHAFRITKSPTYRHYSFEREHDDGGFGRRVLGETWVNHHGHHGKESTRGLIAAGMEKHPIVRGVEDIWGPTDVYGVRLPLPGDSRPLIMGQVLDGMKPAAKPVAGEKNSPMMPVAWTRSYRGSKGGKGRAFATTMGASQDLQSAGLRRLLVNACYWAMGMEKQIPASSKVDLVGAYRPTSFGFGAYTKGVKPADHKR